MDPGEIPGHSLVGEAPGKLIDICNFITTEIHFSSRDLTTYTGPEHVP